MVNNNPNTTTYHLDMSNSPVNRGTTSEAKNTAEKLENRVDNALHSDLVGLTI